MHPELEAYHQQFEQITKDAADLVKGLTEEEFNWRPAAGQWSVEECLSHLTMVGQAELKHIEQTIDRGRERGPTGTGPFEYPALERLLLRETEPPVRHAMTAPKRFVPLHNQPLTAIMPTFNHVQSTFRHQIERADGLDLRRVKVVTPISRLLKVSLGTMFAQAAAHERRHLAQARRVRARIPLGESLPATH